MIQGLFLAVLPFLASAAVIEVEEPRRPPGSMVDHHPESVFNHLTDALAPQPAYATGMVHMDLMMRITAAVEEMRAPGNLFRTITLDPIREFTPCLGGFAGSAENATYMCNDLDLYSFTPHALMGSTERVGNDIWGWSYEGREFGLVGQMDGTAFVEIVDDGKVVYLGRLPTQTDTSIWRDIKVIDNHAYIGSEAMGHGIQVFDLMKLTDTNLRSGPKTFMTKDLTAHYDMLPLGSSHNIVAHEEKKLIAAVGALPRNHTCGAGLMFVDVTDPANPTDAGCAGEDGYVHDAQCLTYHGPHTAYEGRDVCYSFNEDSFTIYDITTPAKPTIISSTHYYGVSYSHQGWVIDEKDQRYVLLDDELDEVNMRGWASNNHTTTYIWDIQNLEKPVLTGHYQSPVKSIDHNLYTLDGLAYEANYKSGLRIVDVSSVTSDPTGAGFHEVAFFDVHPEDDKVGGVVEFGGTWSVYPYFASKFLLVNSMERGLFVLKRA